MYANKQQDVQQKMAMAARMDVIKFFANISPADIANINMATFKIKFPDSLSRRDQDFVAAVKKEVAAYVLKVKEHMRPTFSPPGPSANPSSSASACLSPSCLSPISPLSPLMASPPCVMPLSMPLSALAVPGNNSHYVLSGIMLQFPVASGRNLA